VTVADVARIVAWMAAEPAGAGKDTRMGDWMHRMCTVAVRELPASGVAVSLMTDDGSSGIAASSDATSEALEELQFTLGEGPCVDAFALRRPVLVPDLVGSAEVWWPGYTPAVQHYGVGAVFAFPLQIGASRLGAIDVYRTSAGSLSIDALTLALTFAQIATTTLLDGQASAVEGETAAGLGHARESRYELQQAQGMVMVQLGISLADAMARLRAYAYAQDRSLGLVAADVVARRLTLEQDTS
jgi:GAF domain-containing protein